MLAFNRSAIAARSGHFGGGLGCSEFGCSISFPASRFHQADEPVKRDRGLCFGDASRDEGW